MSAGQSIAMKREKGGGRGAHKVAPACYDVGYCQRGAVVLQLSCTAAAPDKEQQGRRETKPVRFSCRGSHL